MSEGGGIVDEVWKALGFISVGMIVSECYNMRLWRKYYDGRRNR